MKKQLFILLTTLVALNAQAGLSESLQKLQDSNGKSSTVLTGYNRFFASMKNGFSSAATNMSNAVSNGARNVAASGSSTIHNLALKCGLVTAAAEKAPMVE